MTSRSMNTSTKVLYEQGTESYNQLTAEANEEAREHLNELGLDTTAFAEDLKTATETAARLEAEQERAKQHYQKESAEDKAEAEKGFRWIKRLQLRSKLYRLEHPEEAPDLKHRLRYGKIKAPARARGVLYELRILLPEAEKLVGKGLGLESAFMSEGQTILTTLERERKETQEAKAKRIQLTREVREAEKKLISLLKRLEILDEMASIEFDDYQVSFRLDVLARETTRPKSKTTPNDEKSPQVDESID